MSKIIILVGCSSSGKDTLVKELIKRYNYIPIISTTSRPKRINEKNGVEYNFVSKEEIIKGIKNNEFIEYRCYKVANGEEWFYGIKKDEIKLHDNNIYIGITDIDGLIEMKKYLKTIKYENILTSVYLNCSGFIRIKRSLKREGIMTDEQVNEVCRRYLDDMKKIDIRARTECDLIMDNNCEYDFENNLKYFKKEFRNEKDEFIRGN